MFFFRYSVYVSEIFRKNKKEAPKWLQFTIWMILYPLGIFSQLRIISSNVFFFKETQRFSLEMPNIYNFSFSMSLFMQIYLLFQVVIAFYIMKHNLRDIKYRKLHRVQHHK